MSQPLEEAREEFFKDCELVVKAPASFYWAGDFADVYGYPAIVQAIPLYAYVGVLRGRSERKIEMKAVKSVVNITSKGMMPSEFDYMYVVELDKVLWPSGDEFGYFWVHDMLTLDSYMEYRKTRTKKNDFSIKIWCEIPLCCGLNAFAAIAVALSCAVYLVEEGFENYSEVRDVIEKSKYCEDTNFIRNKGFSRVFWRALIIETCLTDSIGSGAGIFTAFLGAKPKDLLLYICNRSDLPVGDDFFYTYKLRPPSIWNLLEKDAEKVDFSARKLETFLNIDNQRNQMPEILIAHSGGKPFGYWKIIEWLKHWFDFLEGDLEILRTYLETLGEGGRGKSQKTDALKRVQQIAEQQEFPFMQILGFYSLKMLNELQEGLPEDISGIKRVVSRVRSFLDFCIHGYKPDYDYTDRIESYDGFSDYLSNNFERPGVPILFKPSGYELNDFFIFGNGEEIKKIETEIVRHNKYRIHYSSRDMGWEAEGLTIVKSPRKKRATVPQPDHDMLEIRFKAKEDKPYIILVNGQLPSKLVPEWLFVHVVLLAAGRKKNRRVNKTADLLFPLGSSLGEQILHDIRDFFEVSFPDLKGKVDRRDMLRSDGQGNVSFELFHEKSIKIGRSVRWFESRHMAVVETMVEEKLLSPDNLESEDGLIRSDNLRDLDSLEFEDDLTYGDKVAAEVAGSKFENEVKFTFRHTRIVMKALEIMNRKFQDEAWWERWTCLQTNCRQLLRRMRWKKQEIEQQLYLPLQRGHQ